MRADFSGADVLENLIPLLFMKMYLKVLSKPFCTYLVWHLISDIIMLKITTVMKSSDDDFKYYTK